MEEDHSELVAVECEKTVALEQVHRVLSQGEEEEEQGGLTRHITHNFSI